MVFPSVETKVTYSSNTDVIGMGRRRRLGDLFIARLGLSRQVGSHNTLTVIGAITVDERKSRPPWEAFSMVTITVAS